MSRRTRYPKPLTVRGRRSAAWYGPGETLRFTPDRGCGAFETDVSLTCPHCGHAEVYVERFELPELEVVDGQAVAHIKCDACADWIELLVDIHCRFPSLEAYQ